MSLKPYTLMDVYDSLEDLNNMAVYLNSGAYTDEIARQVQNLICDKRHGELYEVVTKPKSATQGID